MTRNNQFFFPFGNKLSYQAEDFIVSSANEIPYKFITSWPHWGNSRLSNITYLEGVQFSGKTHLAHLWQDLSHAKFIFEKDFQNNKLEELLESRQCFIIKELENFIKFEQKLFHIFNIIIEQKKYLLITSKYAPSSQDISLPDLLSRLKGCNHIAISNVDDMLLEGMLAKLLSDRQLRVSKETMQFILSKIERSYASINKFIDMIDKKSLSQKRNITIPFLREIDI